VARELGPGVIRDILARVVTESEQMTRRGLTEAAQLLEREAKQNVMKGGTHKHGTKTPASPGGFPALISGTLRRSITHSPVRSAAFGWETRVGTASGFYPPYGKNRTQSAQYGRYLETGLRNGAKYPWLLPAFHTVVPQMVAINAKFLQGPWPHI
jgi:hypothetical protein